MATLFETLTHTERMPERLLGRLDGERRLTDLHHIAQLLHREATAEHLGVAALTSWLRRRIADAADDTADEDRSRRLESDSEAVQVLTIHRSKGLEFPIVYCPYLWLEGYIDERDPPVFHDAANGDRRTIDVGGPDGPAFDEHRRQHVAEERGEELRLAYVALTRARHQAVVWWASSFGSRRSSLARLLFAVQAGMGSGELARAPSEDDVLDRLGALAALAPGSIGVERSTGGDGRRWTAVPASGVALGVRSFDRRLDDQWRRASYTGITAAVYGLEPASEPEVAGTIDEDVPTGPLAAPTEQEGEGERLRAVRLPLAAMAGGARVGSLIHAVLEHTDFTAGDLDAELSEQLGRQLGWDRGAVGPADAVVGGLRLAIETPLGSLVDGRRLRDVGRADRLDELAFELPLVGGDEPVGRLTLDALAAVLDDHVPADDPLAGYAGRLRDPALAQPLRGYLTGSLDAVLRVPSVDGSQRFVVVDYKTNWLGADGEELTAWHYRPEALAAAMQHAHYPLQALFYVVALHRFLRWRLPDYAPGPSPGRRAVPVPARHDGRRRARRRRTAVRRVRLETVDGPRPRRQRAPRPRAGCVMNDVPAATAAVDAFDVRLARRASELLRAFNEAGVLTAADVHVAERLGALGGRRRRAPCCSLRHWPCAPLGSPTSAPTWPPCGTRRRAISTTPSTSSSCRGPPSASGRAASRPARSSPSATPHRRGGHCASTGRACTSSATGARSAASPPTSPAAARRVCRTSMWTCWRLG